MVGETGEYPENGWWLHTLKSFIWELNHAKSCPIWIQNTTKIMIKDQAVPSLEAHAIKTLEEMFRICLFLHLFKLCQLFRAPHRFLERQTLLCLLKITQRIWTRLGPIIFQGTISYG